MDRFALQFGLGYVEPQEEVAILTAQERHHPLEDLGPVASVDDVATLRAAVRDVRVSDELRRYVVDVVRATRTAPGVQLGASPRASLALMAGAPGPGVLRGPAFLGPALVGAMIFGPNTRLTVSSQVFTLALAMLTVAALLSVRAPRGLETRRRLPRFGTVGEPLTYHVLVRNPGPEARAGLSLLEDLEDPRPDFATFVSTHEPDEARRNWFDRKVAYHRWAWLIEQNRRLEIAEHAVPTVPSRTTVEVRVTATPRRRGRARFLGVSVARPDPLGLVRALRQHDLPDALVILPKRYPLPPLQLPGTRRYQPGGITLASSVGDSEEFLSLREYRPGDPLKRIHWRSWARAGKPIVREYQDEFFVRHGLVLDTFLPAPTPAF